MKITAFSKLLTMPILGLALALSSGWSALAAAGETVEVTVNAKQGFKFEPSSVEVPRGARVTLTFENTGLMAHNLKIPELDAGTGTIGADKSEVITLSVDEKGSYEFICDVPGHAEAGMTGTFKVQ